MQLILLNYDDGSYEFIKLKKIQAIRIHKDLIAIEETNTSIYCIPLPDLKEIKFL